MSRSLIPELRFPEFKDAPPWEMKKLGGVAKIESGNGAPQESSAFENGSKPFVRTSDVGKVHFSVSFSEARDWVNEDAVLRHNLKLFPAGTSLLPKSGASTLLNHRVMLSQSAYISSHLSGLMPRSRKITDKFLYYSLCQIDAAALVSDNSYPSLKNTILKELSIPIPSLAEQEKIAGCLSSMDRVIAAAASQLENYKLYKKGLLQKLFPKTGENIPALRFPEFKDAPPWEMKKLKDVARVTAGQSPPGKTYNTEAIGTPFYQGKTDFGDRYLLSPTKWTTQVSKLAQAGDILMSVRAPVGALNITPTEVCIGRGLATIQAASSKQQAASSKQQAASSKQQDFLYYLLLAKQKNIVGNGGSVFDSINKAQIEELSIPLPSLAEQEKIAGCLSSMDNVIAAAASKLENYRLYKKGLLQKLFPAPLKEAAA